MNNSTKEKPVPLSTDVIVNGLSIIICTCNRADSLARTLAGIQRLRLATGRKAEIIVVDNASSDKTADMVKQADASNIAVQYICEPQKGLSKARNAGLAQAKGEFILFTDDDVLPSEDWAEQLVVPLNDGTYDAVTGRVSLSPALKRHWQTPMHNAWMAINDASVTSEAPVLIGANMGFHRRVLESVPLFDPELGVGALGVAEETLFGWQLLEAGFKIGYVPLAKVLHEPNSTRLARHSWLTDAKNRGQTEAYIRHHWRHEKIFAPRTRWLWLSMIFWVRSFLHPKLPLESEGCQAWEMSYLWRAEMYRCFVVERQRPRNYSRRGLVKNVPDEE